MDEKTQVEAAHALGMKPREVLDVVKGDEGTYVQTHDHSVTLIRDDGVLEFNVDAPVKFAPVDESGPEDVAATEGAKVAPKRRS